MRFIAAFILAFTLLIGPTSSVIVGQTTSSVPAIVPAAPLAFGLPDGTLVRLRLGRTMSSADAKTGETVDFEVLEDIKVGEIVVLARGATKRPPGQRRQTRYRPRFGAPCFGRKDRATLLDMQNRSGYHSK